MATSLAPGAYYQVADDANATIAPLRTDIAGFVGIAERGPIDVPVPVESWRQFESTFGGFTGAAYLAFSVRGFFENGGRRCWVVRVASRDAIGGAATASAILRRAATPADPDANAVPPVWRVLASSEGVWGNALVIRVVETHRAQTTADLAVSTPDATVVGSTSGFTRASLVRLTQPGDAPLYRVVNDIDPIRGRLLWTAGRYGGPLPYDAALPELDPRRALAIESVEYTVAVIDHGVSAAVYEEISLVSEHPRYGPAVLPTAQLLSPGEVMRVAKAPPRLALEELRPEFMAGPDDPPRGWVALTADHIAGSARLTLTGGRDGLALLAPGDFVGEDEAAEDTDAVKAAKRRGTRALSLVREVSTVAVPDICIRATFPPEVLPPVPCVPDSCLPTPALPAQPGAAASAVELPPTFSDADIYRVQADLVQHCEDLHDRVALIDSPFDAANKPALGLTAARAWRSRFDSKYAAMYWPWLRVVNPARGPGGGELTRAVPPSGHVAGQFARSDFAHGVHWSPANAPLEWAQDATAPVGDASHGLLNSLGVNVIRALPGRGLRIMGARLVCSDPDWRYLSVRRLVLMVMKAIDLATQWVVFEPNDFATRRKVDLSLTTYLAALWQAGALVGTTMAEAFFVKCDEENNTATDRADGRFTATIGIAPARPFEYIVVRVHRGQNELEIAEAAASGRAAT